jgi:hypothetical protein
MKKIKYLLQQFDAIWSLPLAFFSFWTVGVLMVKMFGYTTAIYDMSFIQPLFLAVTVVVGVSTFSTLGLYFSFRGIYTYLYGYKNSQKKVINKSKEAWEKLAPLSQIIISFTIYFLHFLSIVTVYLKLI